MTKATRRVKVPAMTRPRPTVEGTAATVAAGGDQATTGSSPDEAAGASDAAQPTGAAEMIPVRWVGASGGASGSGGVDASPPWVGSSGRPSSGVDPVTRPSLLPAAGLEARSSRGDAVRMAGGRGARQG